ncbi:MAG: hypothetical protein LBS40_06910 [Burkholderiales bacterium]|nr:hypothetical protein [Burkholderiales bacterium]
MRQRVDYLIRELKKQEAEIIIPAPVFTEILVNAGDAKNQYIKYLQATPFVVSSFGARAAIICAERIHRFGPCKGKITGQTRAKAKFDRQIMAIAEVSKVTEVYSDDLDIYKLGKQIGITVVRSHELEMDPTDLQMPMKLEIPE